MSSRVAIRALGAGLGLLLLAGPARAGLSFTNFIECANPLAVPNDVLGTLENDGSFGFGSLSEKVCKSIVKKGVSLCKSQVKLAVKCNAKTLNSLNSILLKQCAQLTDAADRSDCKVGVKDDVSSVKAANKSNQGTALSLCEMDFADQLASDCANGIPM